jgi:hypothetical protein
MIAHRTLIESPYARAELSRTIASLVDSLARARTMAVEGSSREDLAQVLREATRKLDLADEKLLMLDRRRQRSLFRRADRIRLRIDGLHRSISRATHRI